MVNPEFNSILAAALEEQKRWTSGKDDFISRKTVNDFIDAYHDKAEKEYYFCDEVVTDICRDIGQFVDDLPAADVVAVVRCRECRMYNNESHYCENTGCEWEPYEFCSDGERKKEATP